MKPSIVSSPEAVLPCVSCPMITYKQRQNVAFNLSKECSLRTLPKPETFVINAALRDNESVESIEQTTSIVCPSATIIEQQGRTIS